MYEKVFTPIVELWSTCDQLRLWIATWPIVLKKHNNALYHKQKQFNNRWETKSLASIRKGYKAIFVAYGFLKI